MFSEAVAPRLQGRVFQRPLLGGVQSRRAQIAKRTSHRIRTIRLALQPEHQVGCNGSHPTAENATFGAHILTDIQTKPRRQTRVPEDVRGLAPALAGWGKWWTWKITLQRRCQPGINCLRKTSCRVHLETPHLRVAVVTKEACLTSRRPGAVRLSASPAASRARRPRDNRQDAGAARFSRRLSSCGRGTSAN